MMNIGMMWFDNDPKTSLDTKVLKAADFYRHKYGRSPDLCMVNPANLAKTNPQSEPMLAGRILIQPLRSVMPGHLWIGVDEKLPTSTD
jgi:hypothetical protein